MKVLKFGGTSVGSPENLLKVKEIVNDGQQKVVVLSAMSGVTDLLVKLTEKTASKDKESIKDILNTLESKHIEVIKTLFEDRTQQENHIQYIKECIAAMYVITTNEYTEEIYSKLVTYGETLLTYIFSALLTTNSISNRLLDAKNFMHIDSVEAPNIEKVSTLLDEILNQERVDIYVTQGFVCRDIKGKIGHLKRGGSDYTATIIGAAIEAEEVQIWTDIDGFHNNDPRYVENTRRISHLTYDEAAELAYFGAKILHPQTVSPVTQKGIPVLLKNTFNPVAEGTIISNQYGRKGLKAISAKDNITAIKIKSNRMLMAHGYLRRIFEVFDNYQTAIDMITTSEIAISLTIDNDRHLPEIVREIENYAEVTVERNHSIICVVGEGVIADQEAHKLFEVLNYIPVRMISYGGSNNNISILVETEDKVNTLRFLNQKLFCYEKEELVT